MLEPQLIELKAARVVVCGDTHGDVETTLRLLKKYPLESYTLVMLGDYVDRGERSLENASLRLALKLLLPSRLILLRGNHESMLIIHHFGFFLELARKQRVCLWSCSFGSTRFSQLYSTLLSSNPTGSSSSMGECRPSCQA